ncbi:DUF1115 domain-containing protein [Candidatus Woesearchaeota archaeon]|nr:DUF1115 domain-containing protein [Candidatus Woesearchaeota archaeon]
MTESEFRRIVYAPAGGLYTQGIFYNFMNSLGARIIEKTQRTKLTINTYQLPFGGELEHMICEDPDLTSVCVEGSGKQIEKAKQLILREAKKYN